MSKDEGTNLGAMTAILKVVVNCESLGLEDVSKAHVLGMPCWRRVNMAQLAKMFLWAYMTSLSNLFKQTFISVWHGLKNQGKDVESGQRHISMWVCDHEN
jgi:hypothetical protein